MISVTMTKNLCSKIIDSCVKKFGYNEHSLTLQGVFLCIFFTRYQRDLAYMAHTRAVFDALVYHSEPVGVADRCRGRIWCWATGGRARKARDTSRISPSRPRRSSCAASAETSSSTRSVVTIPISASRLLFPVSWLQRIATNPSVLPIANTPCSNLLQIFWNFKTTLTTNFQCLGFTALTI